MTPVNSNQLNSTQLDLTEDVNCKGRLVRTLESVKSELRGGGVHAAYRLSISLNGGLDGLLDQTLGVLPLEVGLLSKLRIARCDGGSGGLKRSEDVGLVRELLELLLLRLAQLGGDLRIMREGGRRR